MGNFYTHQNNSICVECKCICQCVDDVNEYHTEFIVVVDLGMVENVINFHGRLELI